MTDRTAPKPWPVLESRLELEGRVFNMRTDLAQNPRNGHVHPFHIMESPDWVNVIALTEHQEIILIRQYRFGTGQVTLEIPGGLIDPGDTPALAAARELKEETGYVGGRVKEIGRVRPNPAFLNNTCYTFLIEDVQPTGRQKMDEAEDIVVDLHPVAELPELIRDGRIDHALVLNALFWFFNCGADPK